jgi:RHS repeat-associated protein
MQIGKDGFAYAFDANGNMGSETNSRHFEWNHSDQMKVFRIQTNGAEPSVHAHYFYDAVGLRVKKLVRKQGGQFEVTHYIDGVFEHQHWKSSAQTAENNHVHMMNDKQRIALLRLGSAHPNDRGPAIQFHFGDHLGSSNVVVDASGALVNREEFTPYGETSFGSFSLKRFRFTGKERDEESALNYHEARHYAPWLARWGSADPIGLKGGINQFQYTDSNPIVLNDPSGTEPRNNITVQQLYDKLTEMGFTSEKTGDTTVRLSAPGGSDSYWDIDWKKPSVATFTARAGRSYEIHAVDLASGRESIRERYIETEKTGTRQLSFFERWGAGLVFIFESTVETTFGASYANAPTHPGAKTYDRQSYIDQAKNVAVGVAIGKVGGLVLGKVLAKVKGVPTRVRTGGGGGRGSEGGGGGGRQTLPGWNPPTLPTPRQPTLRGWQPRTRVADMSPEGVVLEHTKESWIAAELQAAGGTKLAVERRGGNVFKEVVLPIFRMADRIFGPDVLP